LRDGFSFLVFLVPQVCELLGPLLVDSLIPAVFNFLGLWFYDHFCLCET
jgi:hypothetical protein